MAPEADLPPEGDEGEEALQQNTPGGVPEGRPLRSQPDRAGQAENEPEDESREAGGPEKGEEDAGQDRPGIVRSIR